MLGLASTLIAASAEGWPSSWALGLGLAAVVAVKLAFEAALLRHLGDAELTPLRRSALLVCGPLRRAAVLRASLAGVGVMGSALLALGWPSFPPVMRVAAAVMILLALLGGEVAERYLFFAAVTRPKMPGGILS
jgi:hypothetical protein